MLHPIVVYYPCPEKCGHLVRDEVMILSSDLKHDSFAVTSFIDKALVHLKDKKDSRKAHCHVVRQLWNTI